MATNAETHTLILLLSLHVGGESYKVEYCMLCGIYKYKAILEDITSLLQSVLLRVRSTSNNANGNKRVIFFSSITRYYGDNDFIIRTFDFIGRSDAVHATCST